jgi:hypothetical protein
MHRVSRNGREPMIDVDTIEDLASAGRVPQPSPWAASAFSAFMGFE